MSERIPRSFPQRFPIVQFPNRSSMVALTAGALAWLRRLFGVAGGAYAVAGLRRSADDLLRARPGD